MDERDVYINAIVLIGELSQLTTRLTTPDASVVAAKYLEENTSGNFGMGIKDPRLRFAYDIVGLSASHLFRRLEVLLGLKFPYTDRDSDYIRSALVNYCLYFGTPERTEAAQHALTLLTFIFSQLLKNAKTETEGAKE